jgi:glyoxylase-like metal-dependent hydrolase (beta-lactamase superfamily II)
MYRAKLGDCFLLAFPGRNQKPVYMLIDCGIHSQYKGGSKIIKDIAKHIRDSTGGHIHVLVMTHEHADHISGFHLARDTFRAMQIDEGWFAWTEDPDNTFARRIDRAKYHRHHRFFPIRGWHGRVFTRDAGPDS